MPEPLRFVSLNIERSKHLQRVLPFVASERPDVLCLQEVMEYDLPAFRHLFGAEGFFAPMNIHIAEGRPGRMGVALFSGLPSKNDLQFYYTGDPAAIDSTTPASKMKNHVALGATVAKGGARYRIFTTHFVWTPNGEADGVQRDALAKLLPFLVSQGELALCGDFNAPRGGELFAELASAYKDNIPCRYSTSIDGALHRAGPLPYMVDGLFTTPDYSALDVELRSGLSDHCAILARLSLARA
jgi:endonuclease/exonuclease/phosphatase family metal-dependent hydrolase